MEHERFYTVVEIVDLLQVHEQTVRRWLKGGQLRGVLLGRKAGYRVRASDLEAFLAERQTPAVEEKSRPRQVLGRDGRTPTRRVSAERGQETS